MAFNNHEFVLQAGVLGRPRSFTLTVGDTYASFTNANWKEAVKSAQAGGRGFDSDDHYRYLAEQCKGVAYRFDKQRSANLIQGDLRSCVKFLVLLPDTEGAGMAGFGGDLPLLFFAEKCMVRSHDFPARHRQ